jgi:hypothetical protein
MDVCQRDTLVGDESVVGHVIVIGLIFCLTDVVNRGA